MASGPRPPTHADTGGTLSVRDEVYSAIRQRLTSGHYGPSDVLIPGTLSAEFETSRTPVREALGLLERDGLLRATSRGFVPWIRSEEEMLEIFEVRAILESAVAAAAASRRTASDLQRLDEVSARTRSADTVDDMRACLNAWHDALRAAAHNATISGLLATLDARVKLAAPWHYGDGEPSRPIAERIAEHDAITEAITAADVERARALMIEHLDHDQEVRVRQRARDLTSP